jgi:TonB family protein
MAGKKRRSSQNNMWIGAGAVIFVFVLIGLAMVSLLFTDTASQKERVIQQVKLLKPPVPPEVKEEPPPPVKENKVVEQKFESKVLEEKQETAEPPPQNESLGLDAKGEAGSDGFGLEARAGGSPIIGGSGGGGSLMQKYSWYNQLVERTIKDRMDEIFKSQGGMPEGNLRAVVDLFLDDQGRVVRYEIHKSSGNKQMDNTVEMAMKEIIITKQPPEGMPRGMRLTIAYKD